MNSHEMNNTENLFEALGLNDQMLTAIKAKGFEKPTQIQELVIPQLLEGEHDLIAQSQTGTGKTATFGLPVMQRVDKNQEGVKAIILVPTRELAIQAAEELLSFNSERRLSIAAIYGGAAITEQLRKLKGGVDIVVGTPGRTLDLVRRKSLKLNNIQYLILDEADEMLNMGFIDDVEEIMSHTPEQRRVMLFSATMPKRIVDMSNKYMRNTEVIKVANQQLTTHLVEQVYYQMREGDKFDALTRIADMEPDFYSIVFCRTKMNVDETVSRLLQRGYKADGLHGDVSQAQREKILRKFRERNINMLIATDVAARGIDVNNLTHVINYGLPQDSESYVHRIGRTGRAGNKGTAISFISKGEQRQFGYIQKAVKAEITLKELPSPKDIVEMKRQRIVNQLNDIIEGGEYSDYSEMAEQFLADNDPHVALSAMIRLAFKSELDYTQYQEIRSFSAERRASGTVRIFIAVGRKDGYTGKKIADMLKQKGDLRDKHIDDVAVLDNYSFANIPQLDADVVVRKLGMVRGRPMAEITKDSEGGEGGSRGGRRERRGGDRRDRGGRGDRGDRGDRGFRSERGDRGFRSERGGDFAPRRTESVPRKSEVTRSNGDSSPSVLSKDEFDWSIFESGDNNWDSRPAKGKAAKAEKPRGGGGSRGASRSGAPRRGAGRGRY